jgi:transposase
VRRKLVSTDPRRKAILRRLRFWWRHRPRGGVLLFFDVQPITVKAYGGRRYTSARRLVLPREQKTRGRFYLFTAYEFNRGVVHWAFLPGKGAGDVCRFMRRVRRWYPGRRVRVALDRDPAHPHKAQRTRRLMRHLGLTWTTLPKKSPDDNPVETIYSDIQQMILDNSNDPDARATQRRLSGHLRARNRRPDRRIKVWYLADTHKK